MRISGIGPWLRGISLKRLGSKELFIQESFYTGCCVVFCSLGEMVSIVQEVHLYANRKTTYSKEIEDTKTLIAMFSRY